MRPQVVPGRRRPRDDDDAPVAVVGAGGFLGSACARALQAADLPVTGYTRTRPCTVGDRVDAGVRRARALVWAATSITPKKAEDEPSLAAADIEAFRSLLRGLGDLPSPPTVLYLSSGGAVYDPMSPPPYREDAPLAPCAAYGRAKVEMESLLADSGAPGTVLRVANAYGPGQRARAGYGVVAHWLGAASRGEPLRLIGDPETTRDYVYVDDVADAMTTVVCHPGPIPPVLNVGTGRPTSLADLARTVLEVTGSPGPVTASPGRAFDVTRTWLDVRLIEETVGWRPRTSLRDGIAATWRASAEPAESLTAHREGPR